MRLVAPKWVLALVPVFAVLGCQKPDVGQRCALQWSDPATAPTPQTTEGDYFQSGNTACDDLVCIVSPADVGDPYGSCSGTACGYCSKPCVSDDDCFKDETGLVCDQIVLDPKFIAQLDATEEGRAALERYLGDVRFSSYCVVPRP
jgi:hypothetical protein